MDDKLNKWKKIFDALSTEFVSPAELKRIFDALVKVFNDFKASVLKEMASTKAEIATHIRNSKAGYKEAERRLADQVEKSERSIASELDEARKQLSDSVKALRNATQTPPALTEAQGRIGDIADRVEYLSTLLTADNIRNMLELLTGDERLDKSAIKGLEDELTEIRNLPRGGNGVSDMRIARAFKYILKTEEPEGAIDGSNTAYTVSQPIYAVMTFSLNGETIAQLPNYTIAGRTITFASALPAVYSGKDFEVKYIAA